MKFYFDREKSLVIEKLQELKIISLDDYGKGLHNKIDFPAGANEIRVIHGRTDSFTDVIDFYCHICSIKYARMAVFKLPDNFYTQSHEFEKFSLSNVNKYIDAYFDGFFDNLYPINPRMNLWKVSLNIENFQEGYKVKLSRAEQIIICKTSKYFLYFSSYAVD